MVNVAKALEEGSLDQDPFLQQFRAKRMEELKKQQATAGSKRWVGWTIGQWLVLIDL